MIDFDNIRDKTDDIIDTITTFLVEVSEQVLDYVEAFYEALDKED